MSLIVTLSDYSKYRRDNPQLIVQFNVISGAVIQCCNDLTLYGVSLICTMCFFQARSDTELQMEAYLLGMIKPGSAEQFNEFRERAQNKHDSPTTL